MNRLLTKRKPKDGVSPHARPSLDDSSPSQHGQSKKGWKWRKTPREPQHEPKMIFSLPSTDSFRTSLIMPNLSARFSMLREQDNPNSILGKASDDSVLEPKRRSRLDLSSTAASSDLIEVPPTGGTVRPSFTTAARQTSSSHGYSSKTDASSLPAGSIMNRKRVGEGNVLFGGRQKVYRIPVREVSSGDKIGAGESRGIRGRALYDDDLSTADFQVVREKDRPKEKARRVADMERGNGEERVGKDISSPPSPPTYSGKRGTTSSTNSAPSRLSASTAATSVGPPSATASSPIIPQHNGPLIHIVDQSINDSGVFTEQGRKPDAGDQQIPPSAEADSPQKNGSSVQMRSVVVQSPGSNTPNPRELVEECESAPDSFADIPSPADGKASLEPQALPTVIDVTPSSNQSLQDSSNSNDTTSLLLQAVHPNDRGKATAMGTFNRPNQQFDEKQYLERQKSLMRQLQRERSKTTTVRPTVSPPRVVLGRRSEEARKPSKADQDDSTVIAESSRTAGKLQLPSTVHQALQAEAGVSESLIEPPQESIDDHATEIGSNGRSSVQQPHQEPSPLLALPPSREPPPIFDHPALKVDLARAKKERRNAWSPSSDSESVTAYLSPAGEYVSGLPAANALHGHGTVAPDSADCADLRGLVREHLRHPSNQSSIFTAPSRSLYGEMPSDDVPEFDLQVPQMYKHINQSKSAEFSASPNIGSIKSFETQTAAGSIAVTPTSQFNYVRNQISEEFDSQSTGADWERELHHQHARGGSSETQAERRAFATELAERQRAIQENLRIKVENESRTPSPMGFRENNRHVLDGSLKPFGLLKSKSSRDLVSQVSESKLLGKLGTIRNASNTSLSGSDKRPPDDTKRFTMREPAMGRTLHFRMPRPSGESYRPSRDWYRPQPDSEAERNGSDTSSHSPPGTYKSAAGSSESSGQSSTGRKSSVEIFASERSHSRTSKYRGEADRYRRHENNNQSNRSHQDSFDFFVVPGAFPHDQSPELVESRKMSAASGYFDRVDNRSLKQLRTNVSAISAHSTPLDSPYSANSTPALSTVSTPNPGTNSSQTPLTSPYDSKDLQLLPATTFSFPARPTRKDARHVHKSDISDPHFISSTAGVSTVALPPGSSLRNGQAEIDAQDVEAGRDRSLSSGSGALKGFLKNVGRAHSDKDVQETPRFATTASPQLRKMSGDGGTRAKHRTMRSAPKSVDARRAVGQGAAMF